MNNGKVSIVELSRETFATTEEVVLRNEPEGPKMAMSQGFGFLVHRPPESRGAELCEIDLRSPCRIARSLPLPDGRFQGVAVYRPLCKIFLSDSTNQALWVVDRTHWSILRQIRLCGGAPGAMAVSAAGEALYVLSCDGSTLWVVDPASNRILGHLANLSGGPAAAEPLADGSHIFVSNWRNDGAICVARVLVRRSVARARTVFAVDHQGNCRISRPVPAASAVA